MKKRITLLLSLSLLAASGTWTQVQAAESRAGNHTLTMFVNKANVSLDGVSYPAAQPTVIVGGTSYAPISMLGARFGYAVSYDTKTRESIVKQGDTEIRWKSGSSSYQVNGVAANFTGKPFIKNGSLMIPVRAWANATGSIVSAAKGQVFLNWAEDETVTADFSVSPTEIFAEQTTLVYASLSDNAGSITAERWETDGEEGLKTLFMDPGLHTITHWVQGQNGEWSEPYAVTVNVLPPNDPPVALFMTSKDTYMIGEPILYTNLSSDDENAIVTREWTNNQPAFFEPGEQTVTLRVVDKHGLSSEVYSKKITISSDVMYTKEEYDQNFTPVGEIYNLDGSSVLRYSQVPYTYEISRRNLIASDSPENVLGEGILYSDTMNGDFRLFLYHQNINSDPLTIYLAATNESLYNASVSLGSNGQAGPNSFGLWTGKQAAARYLESKKAGQTALTTLAPGETKLILPQLGASPLKYNDVFSAYADMNASAPIKFTLFAVKQDGRDPLEVLKSEEFTVLPRDGRHIRGTFYGADREVTVTETLGTIAQRVPFGDHVNDPALDGIDMTGGVNENNSGNYGVVYHMNVEVAANTLIAVNGRGGVYSGVFDINGSAVMVSNTSLLLNPNQACVLYRTGPNPETVDIRFLTALGSNLPVNLLFIPMKQA
ncbi:stalk domain-containing protein [Cohnella lubricantis]|uniref:Copper amine oxidase N-terminal domain-containing protein n=1 Tax=Cohnella lubricantis TaxID=2163172 RepID=A0A841TB03_9BACL|nr:stalk domain-containing protein [Cohnella lubricantis]MBB6676430.1 copper amine oxidase N-terminal domain-containing protein [Cohnella lubricantis]MBP2117563.1 hypothetical protein [Cohnella lubricantis]